MSETVMFAWSIEIQKEDEGLERRLRLSRVKSLILKGESD